MATLNVPYCYLTKKPDEPKYQLFVVVPTTTGKKVDFSNTPSSNGATTVITIQISDDASVTNERQSAVYSLDLTTGSDLAGDNTLEISTELPNQQTYTSSWSYADAEVREPLADSIALDSPYIVLLRMPSETVERHPKVLVPSLEYGYISGMSPNEVPSDSGTASQFSEVAIQKLAQANSTPVWLEPTLIAAYAFTTPIDPGQFTNNHFFEARIITNPPQDAAAPPKARLKTRRYLQQRGLTFFQMVLSFLSRPFLIFRRA